MMAMSGSGGFILHTIKVFNDPDATSVTSHRHGPNKLQKSSEQVENTASQGGASSRTTDDCNYNGDTLMSDVTISP
jgi:tRNA (adenine-N(1)-)-methyltransferase non-catalytic subunit